MKITKVWQKVAIGVGVVFVGSAVISGAIDAATAHTPAKPVVRHVIERVPGPSHTHTVIRRVAGPTKTITIHSPNADCKTFIADTRAMFKLQNEFANKYEAYKATLSDAQEQVVTKSPTGIASDLHTMFNQRENATTAAVSMYELRDQMKHLAHACN